MNYIYNCFWRRLIHPAHEVYNVCICPKANNCRLWIEPDEIYIDHIYLHVAHLLLLLTVYQPSLHQNLEPICPTNFVIKTSQPITSLAWFSVQSNIDKVGLRQCSTTSLNHLPGCHTHMSPRYKTQGYVLPQISIRTDKPKKSTNLCFNKGEILVKTKQIAGFSVCEPAVWTLTRH